MIFFTEITYFTFLNHLLILNGRQLLKQNFTYTSTQKFKEITNSITKNKKVEIETEKEDDSLFVVTDTTDNYANEIPGVDDELVVDLATDTQGSNESTHEISDYMDSENAHDPDQTDECLSEDDNVVTEEETSVKVVPEPRRPLPADATETEKKTLQ